MAEKCLLKATLLSSENSICYWALGATYLQLKQYKKAEFSLLAALGIQDSYLARLQLALVYMEQGRLHEAEQVHLKGLSLKPDSRERHEAYGDFLSDVGRQKEAQKMYQLARLMKV
jgi:Tfp pilus assembly protein PilF